MRHLAALLALLTFIAPAIAAPIAPCGPQSTKTGQTLRVNGSDNFLRSTPSPSGERLVNQKATAALGRTMYQQIDNSTVVHEECHQNGWSLVRIVEPEWLAATHRGWVQRTALRAPKADSKGIEVFTEADFIFDEKTRPHKNVIIAGVNKVHRENARCKDIDPSSAYISGSKGTKADPVFYVTCGKGAGVFNAFFSKSEIEKGATLSAVAHITRSRAIDLCEGYVRANATHPSTVSFSRLMDLTVTDHPNGNTTVRSSFKAKNSFGLELKHDVRCLLNAKGLIEATITEATT